MIEGSLIEEILARHLHEEGSFYASMLCPQTHDDRAALLISISRQNAENERLREALRWYADPHNHSPIEIRRIGHFGPAENNSQIMLDAGERARNALEGKP